MNNKNALKLLQYMQWADNEIFNLISELSEDDISLNLGRNMRSIRDRLYHLAEEHISWYYEITGEDWKEPYNQIQNMNSRSLMEFIKRYHQKWLNFYSKNNRPEFSFNEENGLVTLSSEEVAFNLTNHASYHRGQIMTFLRAFGKEAIITDYKFYKIAQL